MSNDDLKRYKQGKDYNKNDMNTGFNNSIIDIIDQINTSNEKVLKI